MMMVVENRSGTGGIQYIFTPKWTYWEDLLISCKTTWCRAIKNRAFSVFKVTFHTLKPPKFFWKKNSLKNLKLEEQLLVKWLSILIFCIKVYLVKIGLIFDGSASSCLTRYQQILSVCSFRCKNYWIPPAPLWFSTTEITLMYIAPFLSTNSAVNRHQNSAKL